MLTWPHPGTDWADRLEQVLPVFAQIGSAVSQCESLLSVCCSVEFAAMVRERLLAAGAEPRRLLFAVADSDDSWARDHGPLTTLGPGGPVLNDFRFNGWGGKFPASRDDAISAALASGGSFAGAPLVSRAMVLEGGAIETDGAGTLLATRSSVLTATRNPRLDTAAVEAQLRTFLGLDRFLWLDHGDVSGDDTDGHVDTLARFADPQTILYATAPAGDPDHPGLAAMAAQLESLRTRAGTPYRLIPLPFPGVHRDADGRRLPATYANFLVINGAVLLPVYGVAADAEAIRLVAEAFPGREVVAIDCRPIIEQNGSLHCLTMQFPAELRLHTQPEIALQ
jgi:agmatine/peptidylarginine deiminase